MKISSAKTEHASQAVRNKSESGKRANLSGESSHIGREKIALSEKSADMNKIKAMAKPGDEVDEVRVAHLQKLIDDGQYKIDSEAIADRLVDDHLNFPS